MKETRYVMQIMWHLNNECNIQCRHCYIPRQNKQPVDRWLLQQLVIKRIVELSASYEIIRVGLLGGEPLLDPNLIRIISALRENGVNRVDISTNGLLVDRNMANSIKNAGAKMVQVSIEGHTQEVNDAVRGQGSFYKAIHGLRNLRDSDLETGIMTTVHADNLQFMEMIVDMATREGVKIISFNRFLPIGMGESTFLKSLSSEQVMEMIRKIHELDRKFPLTVSSDDPLLFVPMDEHKFTECSFGGCGAGVGNLAISYDGSVYPCRRLPIKVGEVQESSLVEIVRSEKMDPFYDRNKYLKGKCNVCEHREICGGCRASALAFTGDHLAEDPQCWKKEVMKKDVRTE